MTPKTLILLVIISSSAFSCKKVYDYVQHNPTATFDACKINQLIIYLDNKIYIHDVKYNSNGNPISIISRSPSPNYDFYFRYDKKNRLTDWLYTNSEAEYFVWLYYSYNGSVINDTVLQYHGNVHDPRPLPNPHFLLVTIKYYLDGYGRIIKAINTYPNELHTETRHYSYNKQGNLIEPYSFNYDNNINVLRTSKTWQFMNSDYSINNPTNGNYGIPNNYNTYGLPQKFTTRGSILSLAYDSLEIKYDCDVSKINY